MNYRLVESAETKADAGANQSFLGARFHPPAPPEAIDKAAVTIDEHRHYSGDIKNRKPAEQIESGAVKVTLVQGQGSRGLLPRLCTTFGPTYVYEGASSPSEPAANHSYMHVSLCCCHQLEIRWQICNKT